MMLLFRVKTWFDSWFSFFVFCAEKDDRVKLQQLGLKYFFWLLIASSTLHLSAKRLKPATRSQ